MGTSRNIDWEIANLEGGLYTDAARSTSDSMSLVLPPLEHAAMAVSSPPPRAPHLGWGPILAASLAGGALLGLVVAMATPRMHTQPRRAVGAALPRLGRDLRTVP